MALIMVADDDPAIVATLSKVLESRGHQVLAVTDGMQVAEKAQDWRPELIISDIQMPNVFGTTAYQVLRENTETKATPVLFITGLDLESAAKLVPSDPGVRLLAKPLDIDELLSNIEELLTQKR